MATQPEADLTTTSGLATYLSNTPYAADDVQVLSGGSSGFTYRVKMKSGDGSAVIKHALGYAAVRKSLVLSAERMDFEHEALKMVEKFVDGLGESVVRVPKVYYYDSTTHVLVMEDLAPARPLSTVLIESLERNDPAYILRLSTQIGSALGSFMGRFHSWTSLPEQSALRARFLQNTTSRETILGIRYQLMLGTAAKYGLNREWMEGMVDTGMKDAREGGGGGGSVIAMADFWFDNVLVSEDEAEGLRVYIVDWEMARTARPELDVAHFATAAYSLVHACRTDNSFQLMQSFYKSYSAHYELDPIQIGLSGGRDVMSFGVMMPWVRHRDEVTKEEIAREGLKLLEAAKDGDVETVEKNLVVRDMYANIRSPLL
ncbi:kinase-like protein [Ceratobasidium sp. AG-I]|nr:kinase-like protein [Ceratobasidium sp. AG-I]